MEIWKGVFLKLIVKDYGGNVQYVCLPFCWSWPEGWDDFQKGGGSRILGEGNFEIMDIDTSAHWY